jgi:hypothetical protein
MGAGAEGDFGNERRGSLRKGEGGKGQKQKSKKENGTTFHKQLNFSAAR